MVIEFLLNTSFLERILLHIVQQYCTRVEPCLLFLWPSKLRAFLVSYGRLHILCQLHSLFTELDLDLFLLFVMS